MYVYIIHIYIYTCMYIDMATWTGIPFWAWSGPDRADEVPRAPEKFTFLCSGAWGTSLSQSGLTVPKKVCRFPLCVSEPLRNTIQQTVLSVIGNLRSFSPLTFSMARGHGRFAGHCIPCVIGGWFIGNVFGPPLGYSKTLTWYPHVIIGFRWAGLQFENIWILIVVYMLV